MVVQFDILCNNTHYYQEISIFRHIPELVNAGQCGIYNILQNEKNIYIRIVISPKHLNIHVSKKYLLDNFLLPQTPFSIMKKYICLANDEKKRKKNTKN